MNGVHISCILVKFLIQIYTLDLGVSFLIIGQERGLKFLINFFLVQGMGGGGGWSGKNYGTDGGGGGGK